MHKVRVRQAKPAFKKVKEIDAKKAIAVVAQNAPVQKDRGAHNAHDDEQPTSSEQPRAGGQRPDATPILERVPTGSARDITPLIHPTAGTPMTTAAPEEQAARRARPLEADVAEAPTEPRSATPSEAVSPAHVYAAAAETYRSAAPATVYTPAGQQRARHDPGYRVERPSEPETARPIPVLQAPWNDERSPDTRGALQTTRERRFTHDARVPYETRQYEPPNESQSESKKRKRMPWE